MENELNLYINKEIQFLKITYNIHIMVCILLMLIYFIVYQNIYWLFNSIYYMFEISLFLFIFIYFFLISIYLLFLTLKLRQKLLKFFIVISLILFFVVFINSLFCSIISCYNSTLFDTFYNDCPFNYNEDDIISMILIANNNKKIKNICASRKCYNINNNSNIYLCNYYDKEIYYNFYSAQNTNITNEEINAFINICGNYTHFYLNERNKFKEFDID